MTSIVGKKQSLDGPTGILREPEHETMLHRLKSLAVLLGPETVMYRFAALGVHTATVYLLAVHISPWLVGRWFAWFAPSLHLLNTTWAGDWYLQHLAVMTILPALLAGCVVGYNPKSTAAWAWCFPTLVLLYKNPFLRKHVGAIWSIPFR